MAGGSSTSLIPECPEQPVAIMALALTPGVANDIAFSLKNPELQDCYISKVVIVISTAGGTAGSHLDVGIADDASGSGLAVNIFDDVDLNSSGLLDSWIPSDGGLQQKWILWKNDGSVSGSYIVGKIVDANASSLSGTAYITYILENRNV